LASATTATLKATPELEPTRPYTSPVAFTINSVQRRTRAMNQQRAQKAVTTLADPE
jgi:hypothetical protein